MELPKLLKTARDTHQSLYLLSHPAHTAEGQKEGAADTKKEGER